MEAYRVRIYSAARRDLCEIVEYLNTLSTAAAIEYYDLLTEKIASLKAMPERCPLARDVQLKLRGYRFLTVKNYTIFYVIHGDTVQIRRILYARRQFDWML